MPTYDLAVTFIEPCLGTAPMAKDLYTDYIATKPRGALRGDGQATAKRWRGMAGRRVYGARRPGWGMKRMTHL